MPNFLSKIFGLGGGGQTQCSRCAELESKLFTEIDSNRQREDELTNTILGLVNLSTPGRRTLLMRPTEDIQTTQSEPENFITDAEIEREIDDLVYQFATQAENRGVPYTEDDYVRVRAQLKAEYGLTEH